MREIIIRCDHCGNVIDGDPYKVVLQQENRENGLFIDMDPAVKKYQDPVGEMDWCENCFHNLAALLLDTSHLSLATPCQREAPAARDQEDNPEETPVETSSGAMKKNKIDMGRLKALYEAGWSSCLDRTGD